VTPTAPERAGIYSRQSSGKEKSINDQTDENEAAALDCGWQVTARWKDGKSAWRGRAPRDEWPLVLEAIEQRQIDVLILWEASRGDRNAETWLGLLRRCRDNKVRVHVTSEGYTYNVQRDRDWRHLAEQGLDSELESAKTSARVLRGQPGAAQAGHPSHGRTPFGYTRTRELITDPATGKRRMVVRQHIDPDTAPIVREIFERLEKNVPVGTIVRDLNKKATPTLTARKWYRARVTDLAKNPAYAGIRRYNGTTSAGDWPAIVEPEQFRAVQRVLNAPGRLIARPGRQLHLLSYLATCAACGSTLCHVRGRYKCIDKGCVTVVQTPADDLVRTHILARLEQPDVYEKLRRAGADSDRAVLDARNEIATLRERLDGFRDSARRGKTSPETLAVLEDGIGADIKAAQRRETAALVPPALRPFLEPGADVAQRWEAATLPARREVIRALAEIRVDRAASPGSRLFEPERLGRSRWIGDPLTWADHWVGGSA
jgi:site-specific DNA recombinase